ncbi:MAG: histidine kinase [Bacteroidales bacterium]
MLSRLNIALGWILLFAVLNGNSQNNSRIDSLTNILSLNISDTARLNTLGRLANAYIMNKNFGKAEVTLEEAFAFANENNLKTTFHHHWAKADILHHNKKILLAIEEMNMVVKLLKTNGNKKSLAEAQNFLAYNYLYAGKFSDCIALYNENIEFAKTNKIEGIIPAAYSGLSYVYRNLYETEEQRKSLIMMADAAMKEENLSYAANAYLRLGDMSMEMDSNFTAAIRQYKECLKIREEMQDSIGISFMLLRIGWNHYLNGELETALDYYFHSLEYSLPINRLTSITNAYGNIGTIYRDMKEYDKAITYYKQSIEYSLEAKDWYNLSWLYKDISTMNTDQNDYKSAYENHVLHKRYSDSLEMSRYNAGLADARTRYEAETKEKELEVLTLKLEQHKYFTYSATGIIILVIVLGISLIRQNKLSSKKRIMEMNHKISEITQKNLRQQMNPHFIFNTLNSIQYYMYQHDKISTNNYLTKFSSLMRKTLENSQHTSIPIQDELDALELYQQLESIRFKEKFDYEIEVDEDIDTLLCKIPTMLIQPYVENAICHGLVNKDEKGYLKVSLKQNQQSIICSIEDNGIGREAAMEIKKEKNGSHNSLGTKITESRLNLVNALYGNNMKMDYTDLKDKNGNPSGTRVVIHIPIMT